MLVRVKICGITRIEDALVALDAGADALGFIFAPESPRFIRPEAAGEIIGKLPPFVTTVGVFVNASLEHIRQCTRASGISVVQLHGEEPPDFARALPRLPIKAARVRDRSSILPLQSYPCAALLLDSYVPGQHGGTGARFNWDLVEEAKKFAKPVILAGGLTPDNIADAVMKTRPDAVDVSSGVESEPGRKDSAKVREFIRHAKGG